MSESRYSGFLTKSVTERMEAFPTVAVKVAYTRLPGVDFVVAGFLSQVGFYCTMPASRKNDGWAFVRHATLERIGISRKQQDRAATVLSDLGIMEKRLLGMPAKIHYRIDWMALDARIEAISDNQDEVLDDEEGANLACPKGATKDDPKGQARLTERVNQRESVQRVPTEKSPEGLPRVAKLPGAMDPFGLNVPRIHPETYALVAELEKLGNFPSKLQAKPTLRMKAVQDQLDRLRAGTFLAGSNIFPAWLTEVGIPNQEPVPMAVPEKCLRDALDHHARAVAADSQLAVASLSDFFVKRTQEGTNISPFLRFYYHGFGNTGRARVEKLRANLPEAVLKLVDRRRKYDTYPNAPAEAVVLTRVQDMLDWFEARAPKWVATHAQLPECLASFPGFLRAVFEYLDEGQQGTSWIPNIDDAVAKARLATWLSDHKRARINATARTEAEARPKRHEDMAPAYERRAKEAVDSAARGVPLRPEAVAPLTEAEAAERKAISIGLCGISSRENWLKALEWNKLHPDHAYEIPPSRKTEFGL